VPNIEHSGKPFPSALLTPGEDITLSTGCFFTLPRVQHSGKKFHFFETSSPSATLGEEIRFFKPLPRVPVHLTLGEDRVFFF
jgi:hypothetical protein